MTAFCYKLISGYIGGKLPKSVKICQRY